eukprot:Blabericola_migrator_1__11102@NODE_6486_length_524_cov_3_061269_g4432_i0_p1_GENE_NODE_6486_length_524_cov_3_061269_g4432_i0NODE_6486_length_524_cov_3_061269_g4432_i0_p1_ORF_typecomplete_len102_score12_73_NODE_6486_length_524_cov_3_061269_g4432_i03308
MNLVKELEEDAAYDPFPQVLGCVRADAYRRMDIPKSKELVWRDRNVSRETQEWPSMDPFYGCAIYKADKQSRFCRTFSYCACTLEESVLSHETATRVNFQL